MYQRLGMGLSFSKISTNLNKALSTGHRTFSLSELEVWTPLHVMSAELTRTLEHQGELYILGLILDYLLVSGGNSSTDQT